MKVTNYSIGKTSSGPLRDKLSNKPQIHPSSGTLEPALITAVVPSTDSAFKLLKVRKGQRINQKYRNLVGSDQQMQNLEKLDLEKLTVRLGLTTIYFPIFRQARPDFFRVCLQLRKDVTI